MLSLGGTRLQYSVVNADVLALGVKLCVRAFKIFRAPGGGDPLQVGCGLRKMLAQSVGQGARAPDKDSAVPVIVSRGQEFVRLLLVRFLGKAFHAKVF